MGNVTLKLSGVFTQGGQFTVEALTTAPTVGIGGSVSRTRGQQISLPVAYGPAVVAAGCRDIAAGRLRNGDAGAE